MSTLYLHIGGPKTGSTWIQSVLRTNREMLLDHQIFYPQGSEWIDSTPSSWTSGNGNGMMDSIESMAGALEVRSRHPNKSVLYSNEMMLGHMADEEKIAALSEIAKANGYSRINVLYLVRNPVSLSISVWHQMVKYFGISMTIEECIRHRDFMSKRYVDTLAIMKNLEGRQIFHLTTVNYSACSSRLLDVVSDWLAIPATSFILPEASRINRSLTQGELKLQMAMNRVLGGDAHFVARALTESLTELQTADITPDQETQQILWHTLNPLIEKINTYLSPEHWILFDYMNPKQPADTFTFSSEQLELIGRVVAEKIKEMKQPPPMESPHESPIAEPPKASWRRKLMNMIDFSRSQQSVAKSG